MSDPLSFLAGEASSSSESEEDDGGVAPLREPEAPFGDTSNGKLPSPDTLFATVGRPSFLDNPLEGHIDWDRFVRKEETSPEPSAHERGGYAAIPPPNQEESLSKLPSSLGSDATLISAAPVRYSTPGDSTDSKLLTVSNQTTNDDTKTKIGMKRPYKDKGEIEEVSGSKMQKGETFRQKEKRKRDLGQSSRGKSYVEEEKRILRQEYGQER